MSYLYEMHCHSSVSSNCSRFDPEEIVAFYKKHGYTGVCVTDHITGSIRYDKTWPWEKIVTEYCKGYETVKEIGKKEGLDVFFGFEYSILPGAADNLRSTTGNDFLVYGLDKEWLLKNEYVFLGEVTTVLSKLREGGGFIVHAHPYKESPWISGIRLYPPYEDAIEILNASTVDEQNARAKWYAEQYGKAVTGGSDAHSSEITRMSGISSEVKFNDIHDLIDAVRNKKVDIIDKRW